MPPFPGTHVVSQYFIARGATAIASCDIEMAAQRSPAENVQNLSDALEQWYCEHGKSTQKFIFWGYR